MKRNMGNFENENGIMRTQTGEIKNSFSVSSWFNAKGEFRSSVSLTFSGKVPRQNEADRDQLGQLSVRLMDSVRIIVRRSLNIAVSMKNGSGCAKILIKYIFHSNPVQELRYGRALGTVEERQA